MFNLLEQAYQKTESVTSASPLVPAGFRQILMDSNSWECYRDAMSEGLSADVARGFKLLVDNTRIQLLENNNMMMFNPYETLAVPLLRKYFPRLIATQLINTIPMDKPEIVRYFMRVYFKKYGESTFGHLFPSITTDVSRGKTHGVSTTATSSRGTDNGATVNILTEMSLTSSLAHIEKDFVITGVGDGTGTETVAIRPDVDGNFSATVTLTGGETDFISGNINFETGIFSWTSRDNNATAITYQAWANLEENQINTQAKFDLEKIRIVAVDRKIEAEWTLNLEQDLRALFQLDIQSQLVNAIGEQIALDIDREIITDLFAENTSNNAADHTDTFDLNPDATFDGTKVEWFKSIIYNLSKLSNTIYNDTQLGPGNVIALNPVTASVLESLDTFHYEGDGYAGGDLGYIKATLQGAKWRILVSSCVDANKMLVVYRSTDDQRAVYTYCPYIPTLLTPYPLGANPTLSVMTRYGKKSLRPEGIACLNITDSST